VALVGFPNHPNVGDSAIWLGERAWLRLAGHRLVYCADFISYSRRAMSRVLGRDGVILLHGGGNLGDLWPQHEALRQRVMREFPHWRIVQLPQTVHFRTTEGLDAARRVYESCSELVVIARDARSRRLLEERFHVRTDVAPDAALVLGPQSARTAARADVVWLLRTDVEATSRVPPPPGERSAAVDWLDDGVGTLLGMPIGRLRAHVRTLGRRSRRIPPATAAFQRALIPAFDMLARRRVAYGLDVLAQGRRVVSDRLHAHILALLLGIPHVVVDTGYGKISGFFDTWTSGCSITRCAREPAEVARLLEELSDAPRVQRS
jgi:exopolysaccharide biosynthesis predicted pyruvyltransferase EpsI